MLEDQVRLHISTYPRIATDQYNNIIYVNTYIYIIIFIEVLVRFLLTYHMSEFIAIWTFYIDRCWL